MTEKKYCTKCNTHKYLTEFSICNATPKPVGTINRNRKPKDNLQHYCKECCARLAREFRAKHKKDTGNANYRGTGKITQYPKEVRPLVSFIRARVAQAKRNARRNPTLPKCNIDDTYMLNLFYQQQGKCALSNIPMQITGNTNYKASIDKIVPEQGYTKGNVQWTVFMANRAKGDLTNKELLVLCQSIIESATTIKSTEQSGSE